MTKHLSTLDLERLIDLSLTEQVEVTMQDQHHLVHLEACTSCRNQYRLAQSIYLQMERIPLSIENVYEPASILLKSLQTVLNKKHKASKFIRSWISDLQQRTVNQLFDFSVPPSIRVIATIGEYRGLDANAPLAKVPVHVTTDSIPECKITVPSQEVTIEIEDPKQEYKAAIMVDRIRLNNSRIEYCINQQKQSVFSFQNVTASTYLIFFRRHNEE